MKHKWHKEIKAWADGAEIEQYGSHFPSKGWHEFDGTFCDDAEWEFRIKPQPKEPQYLYVFADLDDWEKTRTSVINNKAPHETYIGKIKLEQDNE